MTTEIKRLADVLLKDAGAYGTYPTPASDLVAAAGLKVEHAFFTDDDVLGRMAAAPAARVKRARQDLLGVLDIRGRTIYVRPEVKLGDYWPPLVLHEAAHALLAWQRDGYLYVQEDGSGLDRDVKDQFEREANQFAWELVFQLDHFRNDAEAGEFSLRTPIRLAHRYGTTPYAAIRRYVETSFRSCAVYIWATSTRHGRPGFYPRRPTQSARFTQNFGDVNPRDFLNYFMRNDLLECQDYGARHQLDLSGRDRNPVRCEAQSFKSEGHVFVLVYPEYELLSVPMA